MKHCSNAQLSFLSSLLWDFLSLSNTIPVLDSCPELDPTLSIVLQPYPDFTNPILMSPFLPWFLLPYFEFSNPILRTPTQPWDLLHSPKFSIPILSWVLTLYHEPWVLHPFFEWPNLALVFLTLPFLRSPTPNWDLQLQSEFSNPTLRSPTLPWILQSYPEFSPGINPISLCIPFIWQAANISGSQQ